MHDLGYCPARFFWSMLYCDCPLDTALPDIPAFSCPDNFGQVQKLAFQRLEKTAGTANTMTAESIVKLATWTPLLSAKDGIKVVVTPYIYEPTVEAGAALTYGGGNATPGGIVEILGSESTPFTASFKKLPQTIVKAMKALMCEAGQILVVTPIERTGNISYPTMLSVGSISLFIFPEPSNKFVRSKSIFVSPAINFSLMKRVTVLVI
nr:tail major protein 2 [Bacteroides phage B40-8]